MAKHGNYGVYFPNEQVNVGDRFFFFQSLRNEDRAAPLVSQVESIIAGGLTKLKTETDGNGETIIENSLNLLQRFAIAARADEVDWLQKHVKNNPKIPEALREPIQEESFKENGEFDYINFINYYNLCIQGLNFYQDNLTYEHARLKQLDDAWQDFYDKFKITPNRRRDIISTLDHQRDSKQKNKVITDEAILMKMFQTHAEQQLHKGSPEIQEMFRKAMASQTLINRIASTLNSVYMSLINNPVFQQKVEKLIKKGLTDETKKQVTAMIIGQLAATGAHEVHRIIEESIKQQMSAPERTQRLVDKFLADLDLAEEDADNEDLIDLKLMAKHINDILDDIDQFNRVNKGLFVRLKVRGNALNGSSSKNRKYNTVEGLTRRTREQLNLVVDSYEGLIKSKADSNRFTKAQNGNGTERAKLMRKLAAIAPTVLGDLPKGWRTNRGEYVKIIEAVSAKLLSDKAGINFNGKNNFYSEFVVDLQATNLINRDSVANNKLQRTLSSNLTHPSAKSDVFMIELGEANIPIPSQAEFESLARLILEELSLNPHRGQVQTKSSTKHYKKILRKVQLKAAEKRNGIRFGVTHVESDTYLRRVDYKATLRFLEEETKTSKVAQEVLTALKNSFRISYSVKAYDRYNNRTGVSGGSIGASVEQQVDNITKMLYKGGITFADADWLLFAIYNAGHFLIGNTYKQQLEDFLSIFAETLMFEDTGMQLDYIAQLSPAVTEATASLKYLHLYVVNGIYFPASYILQLTHDRLVEVYATQIQPEIKKGARVEIANVVGYKDIAGERVLKSNADLYAGSTVGTVITTNPQQWIDTFNNNKDRVSLRVMFLAGLLDIIDALEKAMNKLTSGQ